MKKISDLTDEEKKSIPLRFIDLPIRVLNRIPEEVVTLGDLLDLWNKNPDTYFLKIPDLGRVSLNEIYKLLSHSFPNECRYNGYNNNVRILYTYNG